MADSVNLHVVFVNTGETCTIQFDGSIIENLTVSHLKQKIEQSLGIPASFQQYPSLETIKSKPLHDSDTLLSLIPNLNTTESITLQVSSTNTWKTGLMHTNKKSIADTYMKLFIYWKRICFGKDNDNILFGKDILNLLLSFLCCTLYKSAWSEKYKSKDVHCSLNTISWHDSKPTWCLRGKGTIRCEDPLPHGMIHEFQFINYTPSLSYLYSPWDKCGGRPLIGIVDDKFNTWDGYDGIREKPDFLLNKFHHFLGLTINNGGIVFTQTINKNYWDGGLLYCEDARYWHREDRIEFCQIVVKEDHKCTYDYYNEVGHSITVRVNLIDYLLTFWDTKADKILQLRQTLEEYSDEEENSVENENSESEETENGRPVLYDPIVISIPKDMNINWYPAVYLRGHQEHGCTWSAIRGESANMRFQEDF
eukprot:188932_1